MKKISAILLCGLLFLAACSKKSNVSPSMSATINNAAFSAIGFHVTATNSNTPLVSGTNLAPAGSTATTIALSLCADTTGTYNIGSGGCATAFISSSATNGLPVTATSGQIKVTVSNSSYIQGTFSFTAPSSTGTFTVTSGQFTGKY